MAYDHEMNYTISVWRLILVEVEHTNMQYSKYNECCLHNGQCLECDKGKFNGPITKFQSLSFINSDLLLDNVAKGAIKYH